MQIQFAQNKMLKYLICEIKKKNKKNPEQNKTKKPRSGFDFRSAVY